jgi:hypothetical protein
MANFAEGDKVIVKHQKEMGECVVVNPYDETDMVRVGTGKPVGFYVSINTPKAKEQGYHEENLERV